MAERVDEAALIAGFAELERLAGKEYDEPLASVASDPDATRSALRIGRLGGVILKQPFAISKRRTSPSDRTNAHYDWRLVGQRAFNKPSRTATWQYRALEEIRVELIPEEPYLEGASAYDFAWLAQNETGFFGFFARAVRKYICGDAEIRREIEEALKASEKAGAKLPVVTPETIAGSGGAALGVYLVQAIPLLGFVGVPLIAALVVILYRLGVRGYCDWSAQLRTDEDEKH